MAFAPQRATYRTRTCKRGFSIAVASLDIIAFRVTTDVFRGFALFRRRQPDSCAPGFGQPYGNGLTSRARAVFSLADVMKLLPHKFARLSGR